MNKFLKYSKKQNSSCVQGIQGYQFSINFVSCENDDTKLDFHTFIVKR